MQGPGHYSERTPEQSRALGELLEASAGDARRRILLHGATVVTMEPGAGDLLRGDVLVEGDRIAAIGPDLGAAASDGAAIAVELGGMVLVPGLVDSHRHCWQNQFRRLLCDVDDLDTYMASTHGGIALHYRPHDIYVGNLVSAYGALDSGVTCLLDFSHNSRSAAHSDAAFRAYREAGLRAVHASAPPNAGSWDGQWPGDIGRLQEAYATADGMISVRLGLDMRPRPTPELVSVGREAGLAITIDGVMGALSSSEIVAMGQAGVLGPDVTFVHCTDLSDDAWRVLADSGCHVTLAPTSDEQIGIADGVPPIQRALDLGIAPSLSVDVEIALSTDLFSQMRAVLATQRMHVAARRYRGEDPDAAMIGTRDVLEYATLRGAQDNGLGDVVGSIAPGKAADLVAIRADDVNNLPLTNAVGTVVLGTDARNVDTVLVGGRLRKWDGALTGVDAARLRRLAYESRDHVAAEAGFDIDVLAHGTGFPEGSRGADVREWAEGMPAPSAAPAT